MVLSGLVSGETFLSVLFYFAIKFYIQYYLYQCEVDSTVVRPTRTLQSGPPDVSRTHLAPYVTITILTVFPTVPSCDYFININL